MLSALSMSEKSGSIKKFYVTAKNFGSNLTSVLVRKIFNRG